MSDVIATDSKLDKLRAATDCVAEMTRAGASAEQVIASLVADHRAVHRTRWNGSTLRCAGVAASCTYNPGKPLLHNWSKTANLRLVGAAFGGFGHE